MGIIGWYDCIKTQVFKCHLRIYTGTAIWSSFLYTSAQHNSNYTLEMYNINISIILDVSYLQKNPVQKIKKQI